MRFSLKFLVGCTSRFLKPFHCFRLTYVIFHSLVQNLSYPGMATDYLNIWELIFHDLTRKERFMLKAIRDITN